MWWLCECCHCRIKQAIPHLPVKNEQDSWFALIGATPGLPHIEDLVSDNGKGVLNRSA
jgi:hypothetical protein